MYIDKHATLGALHFQPDAMIRKNPVATQHSVLLCTPLTTRGS